MMVVTGSKNKLLLCEYMLLVKVSMWVRRLWIRYQIVVLGELLQQFDFGLFWKVLVVDAIKQILVRILVSRMATGDLEWIWRIQLGVFGFHQALPQLVGILGLQAVKYVLGHSLLILIIVVSWIIQAEIWDGVVESCMWCMVLRPYARTMIFYRYMRRVHFVRRRRCPHVVVDLFVTIFIYNL